MKKHVEIWHIVLIAFIATLLFAYLFSPWWLAGIIVVLTALSSGGPSDGGAR